MTRRAKETEKQAGPREKKKLEFTQKMCVASWTLMACTIMADIILSWFGKEPIPSTTQSLIAFVAVFFQGGMITQSIIRHTSLNRHGLRVPESGGKHYIEKKDNGGNDNEND